jgi:hypothetical protein
MSNNGMLSALEELSRTDASGMLIAVTEDNHQVRIGLQNGEIVHLATQRLQGNEAISAIATNSYRTFNFTSGSPFQVQPDLPATEVILNALRSGKYSEGETDFSASPAPAPAGVDAGLLHIIEEELMEFVGPIASILILEAKRQPSLNAVLQKLAKELPSTAAKEAFVNRIRIRLKAE